MSRRRAALVTAGAAAGAVAGGLIGRTLLAARRRAPTETDRVLSVLPSEDLGPVTSFDGAELAVRAVGDPRDQALVFVHGFSLDMTTWSYQWRSLSDAYRCVLLDQRGHGRSGRPPSGDLSISAMGRDLSAVLKGVVAGPAVLIGHSMGAMAILAMAEEAPRVFAERVAGVVLVGASASDLLRSALLSAGAKLQGRRLAPRLPKAIQMVRRLDHLRHVTPGGIGHLVARMTNFGLGADPELVDYVAGLAAGAPIRVWTDGLARLVDLDLRRAAEGVACPSVVIVGSEDRVTPPASALALAASMPSAELRVLDGAGHMTMMERPDEFNEVVTDLARRVRVRRRSAAARARASGRKRT